MKRLSLLILGRQEIQVTLFSCILTSLVCSHNRLLYFDDIIRILPDTKIPTDGVVVHGTSAINEAAINSESVPVAKAIGSIVHAGTLNTDGIFNIQVSRLLHNNSLSNVVNLVKLAQASRSQLQDLTDKLAAIILPVALSVAVLSFIVWLLVNRYIRDRPWGTCVAEAFTYLIAVMASSCPCALALAVSDRAYIPPHPT